MSPRRVAAVLTRDKRERRGEPCWRVASRYDWFAGGRALSWIVNASFDEFGTVFNETKATPVIATNIIIATMNAFKTCLLV